MRRVMKVLAEKGRLRINRRGRKVEEVVGEG